MSPLAHEGDELLDLLGKPERLNLIDGEGARLTNKPVYARVIAVDTIDPHQFPGPLIDGDSCPLQGGFGLVEGRFEVVVERDDGKPVHLDLGAEPVTHRGFFRQAKDSHQPAETRDALPRLHLLPGRRCLSALLELLIPGKLGNDLDDAVHFLNGGLGI